MLNKCSNKQDWCNILFNIASPTAYVISNEGEISNYKSETFEMKYCDLTSGSTQEFALNGVREPTGYISRDGRPADRELPANYARL
jgi:hypothetical protein